MRVKRRLLCVYYVCTQSILIFQFFNNFGKLSSLKLYDFYIIKQIFVGFFTAIIVFISRLKIKLNPYYGEAVFEFRNQRLHQPVRISNIIKYRKLRLNDEKLHNSSQESDIDVSINSGNYVVINPTSKPDDSDGGKEEL